MAQIHKNDLYFAPVIRVDRARRIEYGYTVPQSEPGARTHLTFGPLRLSSFLWLRAAFEI